MFTMKVALLCRVEGYDGEDICLRHRFTFLFLKGKCHRVFC